jgi:type VI secretion system protein ImpG
MPRPLDRVGDPLRDAFAHAFPALASSLARPLRNPRVEGLVVGLDVLAARVERLLDRTAARASVHYADLLFPELLRPFPSATIGELTPHGSTAAERRPFPAGAEFEGRAVDGVRPRFRAHAPFRIDPWRVEDARLVWSSERGHALEIALAPLVTGESAPPLFPLRLHFGGEPRAAFALLAGVAGHLSAIEVASAEAVLSVPPQALRLWGFAADEPLLPRERFEHPGHRLLREFLMMSAKFAFVEIDAPLAPLRGPSAILRLRFDSPVSPVVTRESVRTNCVPVVNVFETTTEPLRVSLERPSHVLRAAGLAPDQAEIYGVRRVTGRDPEGGRVPIPEGAAFEGVGLVYTLHRATAASGRSSDVRLELESAPDAESLPEVDLLSVDAWATNRGLAQTLGIGDVRVATPQSPASCTFRNLSAVTPYRPAPMGRTLQQRTLALLALSARSLTRADSLQALLHALDLHRDADAQAARAHAHRLSAVRSVHVTPATAPLDHGVARGSDVHVELSERAFDGEGEALLFGRVLAHLFAHEARVNRFVRTTVRLVETGRSWTSPAQSEEREVR